jgi:hypothetical protein
MQKMGILIDSQKVVTVEVQVVDSDGDKYHVLDVDNVGILLNAWMELDIKRRFYSWPAQRDYEDMMVGWYSDAAGLVHGWVSPFWDGRAEWDAHTLEAIDGSLPAGALEYESLIPGGA